VLRALVGIVLVEFIIGRFATTRAIPLAVLVATPVLIYLLRNQVGRLYTKVENRFLQNLNAKELAEVEALSRLPQLAPWHATLARLAVSSDSRVAGQTLLECKFRTLTGATIGMIDRGRNRIFAPSRNERLLPNDVLYLIGTEEQIASAQKLIEPNELPTSPANEDLFTLESFSIENASRYANKSIRESDVGNEFGGLVVGIERGGLRLLNPESSERLEPGDVIWVFGRRDKLRQLRSAEQPI
jgi:CPA2 family monovalent cation:H+ antiporter-2